MTELQHSRSEASADLGQTNSDIWRKEIHSRVAHFRTRRGRRIEGAFSMRFPFPPSEPITGADPLPAAPSRGDEVSRCEPAPVPIAVPATPIGEAEASGLAAEAVVDVPSTEPTPQPVRIADEGPVEATAPRAPDVEPDPLVVVRPRPKPRRKVIAFPRQATAGESLNRLADPVFSEQPRILDVPEELEAYPTTPFLEGLQFDSAAQAPHVPNEHVELPFKSAGVGQRVYAALVDWILVTVAGAVFAWIGHAMLPNIVLNKPARMMAGLSLVLLWAVYQYLLLVYPGRTAGMKAAGIRLSDFKGQSPCLRRRRNRVLGLYLSTASLAMGLLWALVDVDNLCWHDRISGTYLTRHE